MQTTHNFTYLLSASEAVLASAGEAKCFSAMEKCIRAVRAWMMQDKMKLNEARLVFNGLNYASWHLRALFTKEHNRSSSSNAVLLLLLLLL